MAEEVSILSKCRRRIDLSDASFSEDKKRKSGNKQRALSLSSFHLFAQCSGKRSDWGCEMPRKYISKRYQMQDLMLLQRDKKTESQNKSFMPRFWTDTLIRAVRNEWKQIPFEKSLRESGSKPQKRVFTTFRPRMAKRNVLRFQNLAMS